MATRVSVLHSVQTAGTSTGNCSTDRIIRSAVPIYRYFVDRFDDIRN